LRLNVFDRDNVGVLGCIPTLTSQNSPNYVAIEYAQLVIVKALTDRQARDFTEAFATDVVPLLAGERDGVIDHRVLKYMNSINDRWWWLQSLS
jgi:hypothetical protein